MSAFIPNRKVLHAKWLRHTARLLIGVTFTVLADSASGAEYRDLENVAPDSAQAVTLGLEDIDQPQRILPRRNILRDRLAHRGPFWRDAKVEFRFRAYDLDRDIGGIAVAEGSAVGTELTLRSGKWRERISLTATWHTSIGIDARAGFGSTDLLGANQSDISVLSRAYAEIGVTEEIHARLYRQDFNLPYLNRSDSRMIPNTHEAYVIRRPGSRFVFMAGHVTKMKKKDSDTFRPMGEIAGVPGSRSGTTLFGVRNSFTENFSVGFAGLLTRDLFSTVYAETSFKHALSDQWGLQLAGQYSWQKSHGDEQLGEFDTNTWGMRAALSYNATVLTLSRTGVDEDAGIRSPFGGRPSFSSGMIYDFDRAGEDAWRVRLSQNFARLGLPGFSIEVDYTEGRNAISREGDSLKDESAWTLTADFRPEQKRLEGLWLRIRYGEGDRGTSDSARRELRLILNYNLTALQ